MWCRSRVIMRWAKDDDAPPDFLMRLRPGDLVAIESGVAQVEFTCGAQLVLSERVQVADHEPVIRSTAKRA